MIAAFRSRGRFEQGSNTGRRTKYRGSLLEEKRGACQGNNSRRSALLDCVRRPCGLLLHPASCLRRENAASTPASSQVVTNQVSSGQYIAVMYNGTSYHIPAKGQNAPSFACPAGTDPSLCALLQETCGNGVGPGQEPWKTCYNCVFDAGCSGDNSCDPYTHECSSPASACMVIAGGYNQAG